MSLVRLYPNMPNNNHAAPKSRFLTLPTDLRYQIYSHAWDAALLIFKLSISKNGFGYVYVLHKSQSKRRMPEDKGLPIWLLTCKQMYHEGLDGLGRTHAFGASVFSNLNKNDGSGSERVRLG